MAGPMLDRYKRELRCYDEINPVNFEERLSESAVTFAQHNPCLEQVCHFVYKAYQLQWRTYHVVRAEVDGKTETTVKTPEPFTNIPYETRVSVHQLPRSHQVYSHIFAVEIVDERARLNGDAPRGTRDIVLRRGLPYCLYCHYCMNAISFHRTYRVVEPRRILTCRKHTQSRPTTDTSSDQVCNETTVTGLQSSAC